GAYPNGGLILSGKTLYGTAVGLQSSNGTVFKVSIDGTGFTNLHYFTGIPINGGTPVAGVRSLAGLTLSDDTLYGTTQWGGSSGVLCSTSTPMVHGLQRCTISPGSPTMPIFLTPE